LLCSRNVSLCALNVELGRRSSVAPADGESRIFPGQVDATARGSQHRIIRDELKVSASDVSSDVDLGRHVISDRGVARRERGRPAPPRTDVHERHRRRDVGIELIERNDRQRPRAAHERRREADVVLVSRVRPLRLQRREERSASSIRLGVALYLGASRDSYVGICSGRPREECRQRL
jgi:hypothetical protein